MLEKGTAVPSHALGLKERPALMTMFEGGGLVSTTNGAVGILAGATLGGGTKINWAGALPTPAHVRKVGSSKLGDWQGGRS